MIGFVFPHHHNPQLLLTDQRTPEKKQADAMLAIYRDAYPKMADFWGSQLGEVYRGSMTGRLPSSPEMQRIPVIAPGGEVVVSKRDRRFRDVDFGRIETRALAAYAIPKHKIEIDTSAFTAGIEQATLATERFAKSMERFREKAAEMQDRMILMALFGEIDLYKPEPDFARERRINKLLRSSDRRQRKRGERLFKAYRAEKKRQRQAAKMAAYSKGYSGK